ncbi:hypothetical protein [Glycomyces tenuis]|uniref:hypothetical protein n=1 Tax=Glycomyces tenuis TaxID=58116 RepID=UPI00041B6DBE|nr:hypothetical protein [Glycomyces tenuis]
MLYEQDFLDDFFVKSLGVVFSVFELPQHVRGQSGWFRVTAYEGRTQTAHDKVCDFHLVAPRVDWETGLPRRWDMELILALARRITEQQRPTTLLPDVIPGSRPSRGPIPQWSGPRLNFQIQFDEGPPPLSTTDTDERMRLGTLRRFGHTLAIDCEPDDDGAIHFDLAAIAPDQDGEPLGTVTLTSERRLVDGWNAAAVHIGIVEGSQFRTGVHKTLQALTAALTDSVPLDPGHGIRPHRNWEYRIPVAEPKASA